MADREVRESGRAASVFFLGFLIGSLLGAFFGFFFAPHSGEITRRKIKRAVGEMRDQTTEMVERKRAKVD